MYYYDKKTNGFLVQGVNLIPEGAINITDEHYQQLLNGQSQGKQIIADKTGNPVLIDPQPSAAHVLNLDTLTWKISDRKSVV